MKTKISYAILFFLLLGGFFQSAKSQSVLDEVVSHDLQYYKDQLAEIQTHVPQTILDKLNTELINTKVSYLRAELGEIAAAGDKVFYETEIEKYNNLIYEQTIAAQETAQKQSNPSSNTPRILANPDPNNPYGNIPAYVSTGNQAQDAQMVHDWLVLNGLIKD